MFIPWENHLLQFNYIGPSFAHEISNGCRLKVIHETSANRGRTRRGVGLHPNAVIGTVIHKLLEAARRNTFSNNSEPWSIGFANSILEQLVSEEECNLISNPLNQNLIPLNQHEGYDRCWEALSSAVAINSNVGNNIPLPNNDGSSSYYHRLIGAEIDVWDLNDYWDANLNEDSAPIFHLKGQVDLIEETDNGRYNIIDYKTGSIYDSGTLELKESYVTQIKLYGQMWVQTALFRHSISLSLSDLSLLLDGSEGRFEVATEGSIELLQNIREIIHAVNETLASSQSIELISQQLANPSTDSCRNCLYRTGCAPYLENIFLNDGFIENGFDITGEIISEPTPNAVGSIDYQIRVRTTNGEIWMIDNINSRWIEAQNISIGCVYGFFGGREVENSATINFDRRFRLNRHQQAMYPLL